jgi:heme/copper-type cytochrome/quinol oxidase subunit 3
MLVSASIYGCALFSYLYLWTVSPQVWPRDVPGLAWPLIAAALLVASSAAVGLANRTLKQSRLARMNVALGAAIVLLVAAFAAILASHWALSASDSAYGAIVYLLASLAGFYGTVVIAMVLFVIARAAKGMVDPVRRVTFDNARLFWHYTVVQTLAGLLLVHGFPRLIA